MTPNIHIGIRTNPVLKELVQLLSNHKIISSQKTADIMLMLLVFVASKGKKKSKKLTKTVKLEEVKFHIS